MILLFCFSCINPSLIHEQDSFSPALVGIVHKMKWKYKSDCTELEARWFTKLPKETKAQVMVGPKTQNPHFDDDALVILDTIVDDMGNVSLKENITHLPSQTTFINLRVWGNTSSVYKMLIQSQKNGGFPVAKSPKGPYGWAETTIPPCSK
ncbi:MAG: hypothetical protein CL916_02485 [Deltaproteobacteria bacterium]|nr:hypothetical protein [Deltaproteobacteria bacterium]